LAYKYGTDKCPQIKHVYTPFYYGMFKDRRASIKKVLELGIGKYEGMKHVDMVFDPKLNRHYQRGASLKMWRDFFPNAQVYGADIAPETMFEEERITTILCDETKKEDLVALIAKTGSDIDFFVDDGSHVKEHQIFTAQTIIPLIKKEMVYVIEDVAFPDTIAKALSEYNCLIPELPGRKYPKGRLVVIENK